MLIVQLPGRRHFFVTQLYTLLYHQQINQKVFISRTTIRGGIRMASSRAVVVHLLYIRGPQFGSHCSRKYAKLNPIGRLHYLKAKVQVLYVLSHLVSPPFQNQNQNYYIDPRGIFYVTIALDTLEQEEN